MEAVELYLSKGDYRNALRSAMEIKDRIRRLVALVEVLTAFPRDEVLAAMFDTLETTGGTPEKALAHSIMGRAFYLLDREKDAEAHFERAMELVRTIAPQGYRGGRFWRGG